MSTPSKASPRSGTSRRDFLKTSFAAPLAVAAGSTILGSSSSAVEAAVASAGKGELPKRKLGRNGPEVTTIGLGGTMSAHNPQYLDIAWAMGIRYFDTADCYKGGQSERDISRWLKKYPNRREDLFLVTKDHPTNGPRELISQLDRRLERLQTDYVDLFFIHGIGPRSYGRDSLRWPEGGEFKEVVQEIKRSGKARMLGFSCHDGRLIDYLNSAARGRFVDAIMLKYDTFHKEDDALDLALSKCYDAGIGLIAMKEMRMAKYAPKRIPEFDKLGLTTHQAIVQSVLSDKRISAICSAMDNVSQMEENTIAARNYKSPIKTGHRDLLRDTLIRNARITMCPGCPSCDAADAALGGTLLDVSRYVTYYEQDGLLEARDYYRDLRSFIRTASEPDLVAAQAACKYGVDYLEIIRRAERYFA